MKTLFKGAFISALLAFGSFANASIINFNDYAISGYATQARSGSSTVEDGGFTLSLAGNLWVDIFYNSVLTSDSILNFTFEATGLNAELYGIGFDNDENYAAGQSENFGFIGGTQASELVTANLFSDYESGDGVVSFSINIGDYVTGSFNRLIFILDNDAQQSGSFASFTNVEICDNILVCQTSSVTSVSEPSHLGFAGLALLMVGALRRKLR
jgi:hypothetical protein